MRRLAFAVVAAVLLLARSVWAVDLPPTAETAISKAIAILEEASAKTTEEADRNKLQAAIAALQRVAQSDWRPVDLAGVADKPERFKGKTLTMVFTLGESDAGSTLSEYAGKQAPFKAFDSDDKPIEMKIFIPGKLKNMPQAAAADQLEVTFVCKEGKLLEGNEALSIRRPKQ